MADIIRYLNLVTSEHQNKPKFAAWLSAPLGIIDDVTTLANIFDLYFDIDEAIGAQLDVLGQILGVSRIVTFQPSESVSPILTDDYYRLVLKAKILKNQWDGTISKIYELWNTIFSDAYLIIQDNQDMTLIAQVFGLSSSLQQDLVTNGYIVPKPQGVTMNYLFVTDPIFSYDKDTTSFKGYGEGYWGELY